MLFILSFKNMCQLESYVFLKFLSKHWRSRKHLENDSALASAQYNTNALQQNQPE